MTETQTLAQLKRKYDAEMVSALLGAGFTKNAYGKALSWPYASTFPHCSMKSSEYLWPKTKRLVKDERRSKSKLRVCA